MLGETMMKGHPLLPYSPPCDLLHLRNLGRHRFGWKSFHVPQVFCQLLRSPEDQPTVDQVLRQLTLCLRFFTDLIRSFSLFSAASRDHDNEIFLWRNPHGFETWVGGECAIFTMPNLTARSTIRWESVCTTQDLATGVIQLWLDRQCLPRKGGSQGGYAVEMDLVVVEQSFVGEIAEVYL